MASDTVLGLAQGPDLYQFFSVDPDLFFLEFRSRMWAFLGKWILFISKLYPPFRRFVDSTAFISFEPLVNLAKLTLNYIFKKKICCLQNHCYIFV